MTAVEASAYTTSGLDQLPDTKALLARAALSLVPNSRPGAKGSLPNRELVVAGVAQDVEWYAGYSRVCGRGVRDDVLPTWLHVLTFPLQLDLMTAKDFPFPAVGLVHIENQMRLHRPVRVTEELTLSVRSANLRPHRSGAQFDLQERVDVGDEVVWEGTSTYLVRGAKLPGSPDEQPGGDPSHRGIPAGDDAAELTTRALWRADGSMARAYAAQSGDFNPIHMNPLAAKALGFPRTIAHGMWTHAKALAALEARLPEAYTASVEFKKPLLLPTTVAFRADQHIGGAGGTAQNNDSWQYAVTSKDGSRSHLLGAVVPW